ncbi:hypothetical protein LUZ63_003287 [Rhynchospora breviuscula]|uniref:Uncharacterized protein n=1 Tax=Rhynchospora breviuscula TaxID=2022672 RepID=A0A9Q0D0E6_9POAL|nr:hypothetical protein LUZ63_003287 [Rhynchospora breviuscula]
MGGGQSCFSFKEQSYRDDEPSYEPPRYTSNRVRPSDEDRGLYVGDPDVDSKATELIKFYKKRFMDLETQTVG